MRCHGTNNTVDVEIAPEFEPVNSALSTGSIEFEVVFHRGLLEGDYQACCLDRWYQWIIFEYLFDVLMLIKSKEEIPYSHREHIISMYRSLYRAYLAD